MSRLRFLHEEDGVELIEFIGVVPYMLILILIGWQIFLGGYAIVTGAHGVYEGAAALAPCGGGDVYSAVDRASPGLKFSIEEAVRGASSTVVRVRYEAPMIQIAHFLTSNMKIEFSMRAEVPTEKCKGESF